MSDDTQTVEATNTPLGSFKISSANLNTLFTVLGFVLLCVVVQLLWTHQVDAMDQRKDAKETGKAVAAELKDANKEVANALKESNREVSKVLNELSRAMRESNCLAQFVTPQQKSQNAELCKRLSQ